MTITKGELFFFEQIKQYCDIIFDVGCREDVYYLELHPTAQYRLFEPNPKSVRNLRNKINSENVIINNFGLGRNTKSYDYYPDSESFLKRNVDFQSDGISIPLSVKDFNDYIFENNIDHIDFLKMDIEGNEPDILLNNWLFLKRGVRFIQFEYASTWFDRNDGCTIYDIFELYSNYFDFYVLFNDEHPVSETNKNMLTKFSTKQELNFIHKYVENSYGFEIAMIRKDV